MMNNNKILTVSYGTFSCTLEGFDDSFDTMKAIAEYFRDLAADDRYFGAEPPQPDAEMLARIAEREVARRVEAREHEGRIMLKAHEEPVRQKAAGMAAALAAATAAPAPRVDETSLTPQHEAPEQEPEAETISQPAEPEAPEVAAVAQAQDDAPTAAETTRTDETALLHDADQDIRSTDAVNSFAASAAEPSYEDEAEPSYDDTDEADTAAFFALSENDATANAEEEDESAAFDLVSETETPAAAQDIAEFEVEDVAPTAASTDTSLADKLERIRAVVSTQHDDPADVDYDEDTEEPAEMHGFDALEGIEEMPDETSEDTVEQAARDISDAFEIDDAAEAAEQADASDGGDDLDAVLRRIASTDTVAEDDGTAGNLFVENAGTDDPEINAYEDEGDESEFSVSPVTSELQDYEDDALAEATRLSDDLEAELQRDLADLEEEAEQTADKPMSARQDLPDLGNDNGEDVSRLMAEVDHQMQEPEGKTRRSAFAHLRAAVAARFADRSMDEGDKTVEEAAQAYRSDLAEVVKPRRPVASSRADGEENARPAPLKLVAEQRIDTVRDSAARGPISPRRVAAPDLEDPEAADDSGFAYYAEEHGAESLPELLEAAAAYLSFIEGHEQFSRPQLMSRVRQADCGEFSREDGLRAFGQLLRTGKIEKIKGGRFTAADGIGFKPDHRAAG